MRRMSGTVTFFCSMRKRPPRTDGPGGRQVRCPGEAGGRLEAADPRRSRARGRSPVHVRSRRPMRPVSVRSNPRPSRVGVVLPGSKRNVVLHPLSHGPDLLDQVGEIAAVLDEVDVRAVDHQERGLRVTVKVVPERLRQPLQVLRGDAALEVPVALAEPAQQHLRPGLEIDDEVRPRKPLIEHLEDLLVELELVRPERDRGEDAVLGEEVVGDDALREELELAELALPAIALEQEEELGLEGMPLRVLVEFPEEGILLDLLEEEPRPELGGEPSREGRLADADESLDRDVPPRGPVRRHPHPEREIAGPTRRVYGGEPTYGQPPTPLGIIPQSANDSTLSGDGSAWAPGIWFASASACVL